MTISYLPHEFHQTVTALRGFFLRKGFLEIHVQDRLSILAACEDPTNISLFRFGNKLWPLPQTGQMWLEDELLKTPSLEGVFCISTSYRLEQNPKPGRHNLIFPMCEFESKGRLADLIQLEQELCEYLGFGKQSKFPELEYREAMSQYNTQEIRAEEEVKICQDYGNVVMLKNFPLHTSPFWNMAVDQDLGIAKKVDVLIHGIETIGSAERSTDVAQMRDQFYTISNGDYAEILFAKFGRNRVEEELEKFLTYRFFPRFGGGIGITRLILGLRKEKFYDTTEFQLAG
ncbi:MAG TPA: amino acid--tRNA ligase-related protein [Candidatus Nitrosotenuis sp.]|jgi:aspartyl/asparaginyl-tRNA synthetase|nr:amino acid--tRNA ligase-related protein [Candidatus Nitrosotenuis sp.]